MRRLAWISVALLSFASAARGYSLSGAAQAGGDAPDASTGFYNAVDTFLQGQTDIERHSNLAGGTSEAFSSADLDPGVLAVGAIVSGPDESASASAVLADRLTFEAPFDSFSVRFGIDVAGDVALPSGSTCVLARAKVTMRDVVADSDLISTPCGLAGSLPLHLENTITVANHETVFVQAELRAWVESNLAVGQQAGIDLTQGARVFVQPDPGVTYTSGSGVFVPAPEPTGGSLATAALAALVGLARRRGGS